VPVKPEEAVYHLLTNHHMAGGEVGAFPIQTHQAAHAPPANLPHSHGWTGLTFTWWWAAGAAVVLVCLLLAVLNGV
jgi:hypothetical protein